jgi:hypothetical protein
MKWIRKNRVFLSSVLTALFVVFSLGSPVFLHEAGLQKKFSAEQSFQTAKLVGFHFLIKKQHLEKSVVKHPYVTRILVDLKHQTIPYHTQLNAVSVLLRNCILRI